MSRSWAPLVLLCVLAGEPPRGTRAAPGETETVLSLAAGNHPEGISVHQSGAIFVGNRREGATVKHNEILKMTRGTDAVVFARLPDTSAGAEGLLGLTNDPLGNVYAALASFDGNHGVWRVSRDGGQIERLAGSAAIPFPNDLTFDNNGNLYVTDSVGGAIWRAEPGGPFFRWVVDPLLEPLPTDPFGRPLPGANGIAFFPPDILYVANTERGLIAKARVGADGSARSVEAVTVPFAVPAVDGLGVDVYGRIYGVLPGFSLFQRSPVVRIDAATGAVAAVPADASRFDTPLSLAFGNGAWGVKTILVTNGDLAVAPGGPGPGVVKLDVGVTGFPDW